MRKLVIGTILAVLQLCIAHDFVWAQKQSDKLEFEIGNFTVEVERNSLPRNREITFDGKAHSIQDLSIDDLLSHDLSSMKLSGNGNISISNIRVPVKFENIKLTVSKKKLPGISIIGQKLIATSGTVKGKRGTAIQYSLDSTDISINSESIVLSPDSANAKVSILFSLNSFVLSRPNISSTGFFRRIGESIGLLQKKEINKMSIISSKCEIAPDGSISGDSFKGKISVGLNGSVYHIESTDDDFHTVNLGASFPANGGLEQGIHITGVASRESVKIFKFKGTVKPELKETVLLFSFLDSFVQTNISPEDGYLIKFSKIPATNYQAQPSQVKLKYNSGRLINCEGTLWATVVLPDTLKTDSSPEQIKIVDIPLITNENGVAFAKVSKVKLPRLLIGFDDIDPDSAVFGFETIDKKNEISAWLYFSVWHKNHRSFPISKEYEDPYCDTTNAYLAAFDTTFKDPKTQTEFVLHACRPGLSLFCGILYFKASQVIVSGVTGTPGDKFNLKTPVKGILNVTRFGITGKVTADADSFIPSDETDIKKASEHFQSHPYTWEDMIKMGKDDIKPGTTQERFQIAGFRLLDIRPMKLSFCGNSILETEFRYTVHFPFPSFIDLEFEDKSLDAKGYFHDAAGPVSAMTQKGYFHTTAGRVLAMPTMMVKNYSEAIPETRFLWAWRLPVTFSDHGVKMTYTYDSTHGNLWKGDARITMDSSIINRQFEINNSEIHVRPLYSKNSALRAGLRFSAELNNEGNFSLLDYDSSALFAKTYSKDAGKNYIGFDCSIDTILLANENDHPHKRPNDLSWSGRIKFPFFSEQPATFDVKDIIPRKIQTGGFPNKQGYRVACDDSSTIELNIAVNRLEYIYSSGIFKSDSVTGTIKMNTTYDTVDGNLLMPSFTIARVTPNQQSQPMDTMIAETTTICEGNTFKTELWMVNAIQSDNIIDLVCYDSAASAVRNDTGVCCGNSLIGTYEVKSNDKIVLSIDNARAYPWPGVKKIEAADSEMLLLSEGVQDSKINIPGAQLAFEGGYIYGAFGSTITSTAKWLPYEGELRFMLNTGCGHFYIQSAGSFTYVARFSGQLFIVHATYNELCYNSFAGGLFGVNDIIEDIRQRGLFSDRQQFLDMIAPGITNTPAAVLTGVLTSGSISKSFGVLNAEAGSGLYILHNSSKPKPFSAGLFSNFKASGTLGLITARASSQGLINVPDLDVDRSGSLMDELKNCNYKIEEDIQGEVCGSIFLGHCQVGFEGTASISKESGFDVKLNGDVYSDCGSGGVSLRKR